MELPKISFPHASTSAYKLNQTAANGDDERQRSESKTFEQAVLPALNSIAEQDASSVLSNLPAKSEAVPLRKIIESLSKGNCTAEEAHQQFMDLCDTIISSNFHDPEGRQIAQQASTLLDSFNSMVFGPVKKESPKPVKKPEPHDSFLLPSDAPEVQRYLTISVDPASLRTRGKAPVDYESDVKPAPGRPGRKPKNAAKQQVRETAAALPLAAPVGYGGVGRTKKRMPGPNSWTPDVQRQLSVVLRMAMKRDESPGPSQEQQEKLEPLMLSLLGQLKELQVCEQMRTMGATFSNVINTLQIGGYTELEDFQDALKVDAHAAAEAFFEQQNPDTRRGKVLGTAESFTTMITAYIENVLVEVGVKMREARAAEAAARGITEEALIMEQHQQHVAQEVVARIRLPPSIVNNREPYRHGEWRKTPFAPRPYVRLSEYHIVEETTREVIERKLKTSKKGGCNGLHCKERDSLGTYSLENDGFDTSCACLSKNTECDATCACQKTGDCLNRAVSNRATVKMGDDVEEINSWGMDCYTRRNIQDAVLEAQVFGYYKIPNYKIKAATQHAATAAGQLAAVAAGSPLGGAAPDTTEGATTTEATQAEPSENNNNGTRRTRSRQGNNESSRPASAAGGEGPEPMIIQEPQMTAQEKKEHKAMLDRCVAEWVDRTLIPAINSQGDDGWDILKALEHVKQRGIAAGDAKSVAAAEAVEARVAHVGHNYFQIHPKGVGLVCKRNGGLPRLTFVEEYLGEIHTPYRWFELQDAVKKITGDELPDFYNILLERPKDDPAGYDVLFVDAAAKGAFASRMSHSCTPNCQAVIMACGGRLTIALYTLRHVQEGEELTFDYSSVTESEKEFREAICLCGTTMCRGSYLYFTGSRAFQQVMNAKHTMLHRQAILARAGSEPLTQEDLDRIKRHGLGESALGSEAHGDRAPDWLIKWTALICEYLELEESCLRQDLLRSSNLYTEATAGAEAKGVIANRLQNIVITLDKVKMFISNGDQPQEAPLQKLSDREVINHLWNGMKSVARKMLKGVASVLSPMVVNRTILAAEDEASLEIALSEQRSQMSEGLIRVVDLILPTVDTVEEARSKLLQLHDLLRELDCEKGGGLTAAADLCYLYANTKHWISHIKGYKGITSPPVPINLHDLFLNRAQEKLDLPDTAATTQEPVEETEEQKAAKLEREQQQQAAAARLARTHRNSPALKKLYRPTYVWGQLNGWFKQTVNDPTASLSAERRGTLSLPDVESAFSGKGNYGYKERWDMIEHINNRPDGMWKVGTIWAFRNESKIYGSPMLDGAWAEVAREQGDSTLPAVVAALKAAKTPLEPPVGGLKRRGGGRPRATTASAPKRPRGKGKKKNTESEDEDDMMFEHMLESGMFNLNG